MFILDSAKLCENIANTFLDNNLESKREQGRSNFLKEKYDKCIIALRSRSLSRSSSCSRSRSRSSSKLTKNVEVRKNTLRTEISKPKKGALKRISMCNDEYKSRSPSYTPPGTILTDNFQQEDCRPENLCLRKSPKITSEYNVQTSFSTHNPDFTRQECLASNYMVSK